MAGLDTLIEKFGQLFDSLGWQFLQHQVGYPIDAGRFLCSGVSDNDKDIGPVDEVGGTKHWLVQK